MPTQNSHHSAVSSRIPHFGAFESTKIHGYNTDVLETTRHLEKWREDLDMLADAGVLDLRYSAPWHRIERVQGEFDFRWLDGPMEHMRKLGMRPVIDLLHHTSFPDWLEDGFANPAFPALYARFVRDFVTRYEWADRFTLFNEPLATTLMCSLIGAWYPFRNSDRAFTGMAVNVARAICQAEQTVRSINPRYCSVYIDTCECHHSPDDASSRWVEFMNHRRFLFLDLVLGKVDGAHVLHPYLHNNGMKDADAGWLRDHPISIDLLGLDYYAHAEIDWRRCPESSGPDITWPVSSPRGLASVATDYVERYRLPIMISETNVRGTIFDRITWLRFMEEQTEILNASTPVYGFCWYPSVDSTDWCHVCAKSTCSVDPQGIWYLDDDRRIRYGSELSDWYTRLAKGTAVYSDLPAYRFRAPLDRGLAGYQKLMSHWDNWVEDGSLEEAA